MALGPERRGKVLDRERRDRKEITLAGEKKMLADNRVGRASRSKVRMEFSVSEKKALRALTIGRQWWASESNFSWT